MGFIGVIGVGDQMKLSAPKAGPVGGTPARWRDGRVFARVRCACRGCVARVASGGVSRVRIARGHVSRVRNFNGCRPIPDRRMVSMS